MSQSELLVIVGSRLQAISAAAIALAAVIALVDTQPIVVVPAVAATLFAGSRMLLRVELDADHVRVRRWRGSATVARPDVTSSFGHRYLDLDFPSHPSVRIEVPVEIRPQVRIWSDGPENDQRVQSS